MTARGSCSGASVGGGDDQHERGVRDHPLVSARFAGEGHLRQRQGQRFINEDCYHGRVSNYILRQSGDRIWLLQDHATYAMGEMQQLAKMEIGAAGETWEEVERELKLPAGLAHRHGAALQPLRRRRAPTRCSTRRASGSSRCNEPPFVAIDCRIDHCFYASFTLGGLDTLPTGEVVDADRKVIGGLFAAGRTACGLPRWGEGYSSGMSLADAYVLRPPGR